MTAWFSLHISVFAIPESRFLSSGISRLPLVKIAISRVPVIITIPNISSPFSFKIPNSDLEISQIPDPEKPIGDPRKLHNSRGKHKTWHNNSTPHLCIQRVFCVKEGFILLRNCWCLVCEEVKHEHLYLPTKEEFKAFSLNLIPLSNAVSQWNMENV